MKSFTILLLAVLATCIAGSPRPNVLEGIEPVKRAACHHESECSWFSGAKCEHYCRQFGADVANMEKCNLLNQKRCCCTS
jgi:hypothetical protein